MSIAALNWAFLQNIGSSPKFILVALANCADKDTGMAYPSVALLREMTGLDRKTVLVALQTLLERGLIRDTGDRKGRTAQVKVFHLTVPKTGLLNGTVNGTLSHRTVPDFLAKSPKFPCEESQKRDTEPSRTTIEPHEDLSTRLKSMIASFDKVGNKAKADRYRRELEALGI